MDWEFEILAGPFGGTTEGPAWDGQALVFTHIPGNRIMRFDPQSGACSEWRTGTQGANGLMFDANGNLYGCQSKGHCIARFEKDGRITPLPNNLDGKRHNRPNDLAIDSRGRIWFTDPFGRGPVEERELDHASVLRLDPQEGGGNWTLQRMTFDTTLPNGILFSPDERTLYVADGDKKQAVRELKAYAIEGDKLGDYTVLHTFGRDSRGVHRGVDGMCLDADGNIVACTGWNHAGPGPMIFVFSPTGQVLETHKPPVDHPTNCTFGDADLKTLYITTGGGHLLRVRNTGRRGWRR